MLTRTVTPAHLPPTFTQGFTSDHTMKPFYTLFVEKGVEAAKTAQSEKDSFASKQKKTAGDDDASGGVDGSHEVDGADAGGGDADTDGPAPKAGAKETGKAASKTTKAASPKGKGKGKRTGGQAFCVKGWELSRYILPQREHAASRSRA